MHRSASWSRFSEDYYKHVATSPAKATLGQRSTSSFDVNDLPVYDPPIAELAKKEKARVRFAENAVHVIPFVLLFCAFMLWFFSNPGDFGSWHFNFVLESFNF